MRFKILNGFHFAVGRNRGDQVLLAHSIDAYRNASLATGNKCRQHHYGNDGDNYESPNMPSIAIFAVVISHLLMKVKYIEPARSSGEGECF